MHDDHDSLKAGDVRTWSLIVALAVGWAMLVRFSRIRCDKVLRGLLCCRFVAAGCCLILRLYFYLIQMTLKLITGLHMVRRFSRRVFSLKGTFRVFGHRKAREANRADTMRIGPAHSEWLRRCRRLNIGLKTSRRLWKLVIRGLELASAGQEPEARAVFDQLAQEIQKRFPQNIREPYVFWSGAHSKQHAQGLGYTMEKSPWGRLFDGWDLSDDWHCVRPLWASLSRAFAVQACSLPNKHAMPATQFSLQKNFPSSLGARCSCSTNSFLHVWQGR
ncbi:unnamed protein product [Symbiodinium sp. CCMP2592]|nr:unnamed protein product [Symbiodinium sp. CCMP2592]